MNEWKTKLEEARERAFHMTEETGENNAKN